MHNNLGVVLAAMDSLAKADEHWRASLALGRRDPGIGLNRGIAQWARGDSAGAAPLLGTAVAEAGGYVAACKLVGLSPEDTLDRGADLSNEELILRSRIRSLLRQNGVAGKERGPVSNHPSTSDTTPTNVPLREMSKYLYWIE